LRSLPGAGREVENGDRFPGERVEVQVGLAFEEERQAIHRSLDKGRHDRGVEGAEHPGCLPGSQDLLDRRDRCRVVVGAVGEPPFTKMSASAFILARLAATNSTVPSI
jgi:hypothetical protein